GGGPKASGPPRLRGSRRVGHSCESAGRVDVPLAHFVWTGAGDVAVTVPTRLSALSFTSITRYCRPNTVWSFGEKLTGPAIVATFVNFSIFAASTVLTVEPPARLIAATMPSIAAA